MIMKRHEFPENIPEILENIPMPALLVFRLTLWSTWPFCLVSRVTIHVVGISFIVFIVVVLILAIVIVAIQVMLRVVVIALCKCIIIIPMIIIPSRIIWLLM